MKFAIDNFIVYKDLSEIFNDCEQKSQQKKLQAIPIIRAAMVPLFWVNGPTSP